MLLKASKLIQTVEEVVIVHKKVFLNYNVVGLTLYILSLKGKAFSIAVVCQGSLSAYKQQNETSLVLQSFNFCSLKVEHF